MSTANIDLKIVPMVVIPASVRAILEAEIDDLLPKVIRAATDVENARNNLDFAEETSRLLKADLADLRAVLGEVAS